MANIRKLTRKEIEGLIKNRGKFISAKAKIIKLLEPRIFRLEIENINNVRNIAIISGALATFGLLLLDNTVVYSNISFLKISIIGFLFTIIFSFFQINKSITRGINSYYKTLRENIATVEKGEKIVNNCLDGKISKPKTDKQLTSVYTEIEYKRVRPGEKKKEEKTYIYDLVSYLFSSSISALILYFIYTPLIELLLGL